MAFIHEYVRPIPRLPRLTEAHGLSKKPAFVGMSRGGVNEYDWTTANPDKVSL